MDQGVIRASKAYYRTKVVKRQIKCIDAGKEVVCVNILDAIRMLVQSWDAVSSKTDVDGEDEEDEESIVVEDESPQKPSLADVGDAIELIESWSLFDVDGNEVRKSLYLISKKLDKHSLEAKKQKKISDFFGNL